MLLNSVVNINCVRVSRHSQHCVLGFLGRIEQHRRLQKHFTFKQFLGHKRLDDIISLECCDGATLLKNLLLLFFSHDPSH